MSDTHNSEDYPEGYCHGYDDAMEKMNKEVERLEKENKLLRLNRDFLVEQYEAASRENWALRRQREWW